MVEAKLLVVGIDGLRWDRVEDADAPRLMSLRDRGVFAPSLIPLEYGAETVSGTGLVDDRDRRLAGQARCARQRVRGQTVRPVPRFPHPDRAHRPVDAGGRRLAAARRRRACSRLRSVTSSSGDGEAHGYLVEDRRLTGEAVRLLRHGQPDAAFVYLGSVDMVGHGWGAMSTEYVDMIRAVDGCLGQLLDAVDRRPGRGASTG